MGKYFIKTYGCAMNVADSAKLAQVLESAGYREAASENETDILLVNTCVVRQTAEDRAAWYLTSAKGLKAENPNLKIALCGCFVSEPGRDVRKQFPHVDFFLPPNSSVKLKKYLSSAFGIRHSALKVPCSSALVTIMHGCDNFCSYCVVPYVRGREQSRPMEEVLAEIKGLIDQGVTDLTLLGQNVNSYKYGLANLLIKIHSFGIRHSAFGIRFLTSHPRDMSDEIIQAVYELPYVAKEFVMPLQSGDDEILRKMNRGYTLAYYLDRVAKIRSLMSQARITTDVIVGFPGETEEQFQNTLRAIEQIKFHHVHMFAYSSRPETAAAGLPGQLPEEVKQNRLQKLIQVVRRLVK